MTNVSKFTSVPTIAERSEATPGLWNNIVSVVSQNIDQLNSDVGSTLSFGANPATTGFFRLPASGDIRMRDTANAVDRLFIGENQVSGVSILDIGDSSPSRWSDIRFHPGALNRLTIGPASPIITSASTIRIVQAPATVGLSSTAAGAAGDFTFGSSTTVAYLYLCISTNSWMRVALAGW